MFLKEAATVFNDRSGGNSKTESDSMRRNQTLKDVDMKIDKDGYFRLAIGDFGEGDGETPATNVIRTTSKSGLLVMRCFKVKVSPSSHYFLKSNNVRFCVSSFSNNPNIQIPRMAHLGSLQTSTP